MADAVIDRTCSAARCEHAGTYSLACHCSNCGWAGQIELSKGHGFPVIALPECLRCGCRTIRKGL